MNTYTALYSNLAQAYGESFDTQGHAEGSMGASVVALLVVLVLIVVQLFVIQFLWNLVLVPLLTVARPMKSLVSALGLILLLALLVPGCCM
jgi:hypothetical protein